MTPAPTFLREMWPFFLLGKLGETACTGQPLSALLTPATPEALRRTYRPVLADTNPTAATGLDSTTDAELELWCKVLGGPKLEGNPDEPTFMPSWVIADNSFMLTGLTRLLHLALFERQDVFLAAMHKRGLA